ncbi:MAG: serine protease [Betaproteobacteria bacterium]
MAALPRHALAGIEDTIARVKPSIVAVGTLQPSRNPTFLFSGTGFAVGDGSLIATNAHVIPRTLDTDRRETLVIALPNRTGGEAAAYPARVVAIDREYDLAVIAIEGKRLPALQLNTGAALREGQELFFTGFPIGTVLGLIAATHRGMVSALTPISIPRSSATELDAAAIKRLSGSPYQVIQLDGTAYPGNSGSPLYDANGVVFGIINMVFVKGARENALSQPSGISYAIPSQPLAEMVAVHRR